MTPVYRDLNGGNGGTPLLSCRGREKAACRISVIRYTCMSYIPSDPRDVAESRVVDDFLRETRYVWEHRGHQVPQLPSWDEHATRTTALLGLECMLIRHFSRMWLAVRPIPGLDS